MSARLDRRSVLAALGAASAAACLRPRLSLEREFDLVLRGGTVLDGSGTPGVVTDVGLAGDRIVALARIDPARSRAVLDVSGLCVAPGFVDIHSHSDRTLLDCPTADSRVLQGYTTEITGNCGGSIVPRAPGRDGEEDERRAWSDVRGWFEALRATRTSLNVALLVGHGTLRRNAFGSVDRAPDEAETRAMIRALEESLEQGALGLSTGLEYVPGLYSKPAEIERLAAVVALRGGLYASHMRNETSKLLGALRETIDVGRRTGVRVEVSHLKAAGSRNWPLQPASLRLVEAARAEGVDVLADAYPYTAYSTGLTILLPPWSKDGGEKALLARLGDPATRARILRETIETVDDDPGGFERIAISSVRTSANARFVGRTIADLADAWRVAPGEALLRLLEEESCDVSYIGHAMSAENVELVLAHPLVMVGSDGVSRAVHGDDAAGRPHPRSFGTAARVLGQLCRERGVFDLATAVKKLASMPAERAGLADRGLVQVGRKADLVVFDASTVRDLTTFEDPTRPPAGIVHVLVNGVQVVRGGAHTGARPGEVLARA